MHWLQVFHATRNDDYIVEIHLSRNERSQRGLMHDVKLQMLSDGADRKGDVSILAVHDFVSAMTDKWRASRVLWRTRDAVGIAISCSRWRRCNHFVLRWRRCNHFGRKPVWGIRVREPTYHEQCPRGTQSTLLATRLYIATYVSCRPEHQTHPNATVVELETSPATLRLAPLRVPRLTFRISTKRTDLQEIDSRHVQDSESVDKA